MTFKEIEQALLKYNELSLAEIAAFRGNDAKKNLDWHKLISTKERGWFSACSDCIKKCDIETLDKWIEEEKLKKELQNYLGTDYGNYGGDKLYNVFHAHLLCAKAVIEHGHWTSQGIPINEQENILPSIAKSTGQPIGFLRDLIQEFLTGNIRPAEGRQSLVALLIEIDPSGKKEEEGIIASLILELMPDGNCSFYPIPAISLLPRDSEFRESEKNAFEYARSFLPAGFDIRWNLEMIDKRPLSSVLIGGSLGGNFCVGMLKLLADSF